MWRSTIRSAEAVEPAAARTAAGTTATAAGPWLALLLVGCTLGWWGESGAAESHLSRARVYLQAADYRRAVEACQRQIDEKPSAESYVYLTYVYHAIDGYLDSLAAEDRWVAVGQLYLNLASADPAALTDPPDVLARIAKEIIQGSVRQQADVTAAMATKLDRDITERLWKQQSAWRATKPESWWSGVPPEWRW